MIGEERESALYVLRGKKDGGTYGQRKKQRDTDT